MLPETQRCLVDSSGVWVRFAATWAAHPACAIASNERSSGAGTLDGQFVGRAVLNVGAVHGRLAHIVPRGRPVLIDMSVTIMCNRSAAGTPAGCQVSQSTMPQSDRRWVRRLPTQRSPWRSTP